MRFETLAVHAGHGVDPTTGAVTPPIHLTTTFERAEDGSYPSGHIYARTSNPNRTMLETCLAAIEGGAAAAAFASGSAATMTVFQALAPGDHVIAPADAYFGTAKLLRDVFEPWGLAVTFVDMTGLDAVQAAIRPHTRLLWIETPSNPLLKVTDIAATARIAHAAGALLVADNTWASPVVQRPLDHGADIVMHSTTKYLSGHSDVLGGALIAREPSPFFDRVRMLQGTGGAVPSPFECWLVARGIRTLPVRVHAQSAGAMTVARFLATHPKVEAVHYPGLPAHPGHEVAARQRTCGPEAPPDRDPGFGGMLSLQVRGGAAEALAMTTRLKLLTRATSLGGTESLIEHRASVEGPGTTTPQNLLRVSIGLEHPDDLIDDLARALA